MKLNRPDTMKLLEAMARIIEVCTDAKSIVIMAGEKEFPCPDPGCVEHHQVNCMASGFKDALGLKNFVFNALGSVNSESLPKTEGTNGIVSPYSPEKI